MKLISTRRAIVPCVAALALVLTGCGSSDDSESSDLSGEIAGAGASSQGAAQEAWIASYTEVAPDVTVSYDPIGSGGGREQFTTGGVNFGGSDAYLEDEEIAAAQEICGGDFIEFPAYISPIVVAFNLPGVEDLTLNASLIAQIFNGQVTQWNDPAIAALNEGVELPSAAITTVHRSDESGTTENFVDYLAQAAPADWPYEVDGNWPAPGGVASPQNQGVAQSLNSTENTIGYIDASLAGDLGTVAIDLGDDAVVEFSPEAAANAVDEAEPVADRPEYSFAIDLPRTTTNPEVYPIVLVSYQLACTSYDDAETADLVKSYFNFIVSEDGQAAAAEFAGSSPIGDGLRENAENAIDAITAG